MDKVIRMLSERAEMVRGFEKKAHAALYENSDKLSYKNLLREKTVLLCHLLEEVELIGYECGLQIRKAIRDCIGGISFSACKALKLDSVFYMSALLYPENYQEGDRNDLEQLIDALKERV